MAAGFALDTC
jgi:hypothetical protein